MSTIQDLSIHYGSVESGMQELSPELSATTEAFALVGVRKDGSNARVMVGKSLYSSREQAEIEAGRRRGAFGEVHVVKVELVVSVDDVMESGVELYAMGILDHIEAIPPEFKHAEL